MRIRSIRYDSDSGWQKDISFGSFDTDQIYVPRVGDTIRNKYGDYYKVKVVEFALESDHVNIYCKKITRNALQKEITRKCND